MSIKKAYIFSIREKKAVAFSVTHSEDEGLWKCYIHRKPEESIEQPCWRVWMNEWGSEYERNGKKRNVIKSCKGQEIVKCHDRQWLEETLYIEEYFTCAAQQCMMCIVVDWILLTVNGWG